MDYLGEEKMNSNRLYENLKDWLDNECPKLTDLQKKVLLTQVVEYGNARFEDGSEEEIWNNYENR